MTWKSFPINYLFLEIKFPNFSSTSKKVSSFFLPPSSSFSMAEIRAYVIQIAVPACVPLSKSPQPNGRPARSICPLSPPPKIFFSLVQHKLSRNYDSFVPSTMLIGMRVHARAAGPQRWSAHISTRRLQNGAYTRRWRLHCLARVCARYAIILCRWWVAHASPHPR